MSLKESECRRCRRVAEEIAEKAGGEVGSVPYVAGSTTLLGGYIAILCTTCRNAWSDLLHGSGDWTLYRRLHAARELAAYQITGADLEAGGDYTKFIEQLIVAEDDLFRKGRTFVEGGLP